MSEHPLNERRAAIFPTMEVVTRQRRWSGVRAGTGRIGPRDGPRGSRKSTGKLGRPRRPLKDLPMPRTNGASERAAPRSRRRTRIETERDAAARLRIAWTENEQRDTGRHQHPCADVESTRQGSRAFTVGLELLVAGVHAP